MNKKAYIILTAIVAAISLYITQFLIAHNLYFYSSKSIFFYDLGILSKKLSLVGGFSDSITSLIAQFLHIEYLGAVITSILITLCIILLTKVSQKLTIKNGDYFYLSILPSIYFLTTLSSNELSFDIFVSLILTLAVVLSCARCKSIVALTIISSISYLLIGEMAIIFPILLLLRGDVRYRYIPLALFAILPFIYAMVCLFTLGDLYKPFLEGEMLLYASLALLALAANRFLPDIGKNRGMKWAIFAIFISIVVISATKRAIKGYSNQERLTILMEKAMIESDYEQLKRLAISYPSNNIFKAYAINLALLSTGRLAEDALKYANRYAAEGLNFGRTDGNIKNDYAHYIYSKLSLYSQSHRYIFYSMLYTGYNRINLNLLVDYNRKMGRDNIADKFSRLLDKTILSNDFYTESTSPIIDFDIQNTKTSNPYNICIDLMRLEASHYLSKDQTDCLLVGLLLCNRVFGLVKYKEYLQRYYLGTTLPPIYDQALAILKDIMSEEEFSEIGFEPTEQSIELYRGYKDKFTKSRGNVRMLADFKESYFYYLNFITPHKPAIVTEIGNY